MNYLDQITDLMNTAKDAAETLTGMAGDIEVLEAKLERVREFRDVLLHAYGDTDHGQWIVGRLGEALGDGDA